MSLPPMLVALPGTLTVAATGLSGRAVVDGGADAGGDSGPTGSALSFDPGSSWPVEITSTDVVLWDAALHHLGRLHGSHCLGEQRKQWRCYVRRHAQQQHGDDLRGGHQRLRQLSRYDLHLALDQLVRFADGDHHAGLERPRRQHPLGERGRFRVHSFQGDWRDGKCSLSWKHEHHPPVSIAPSASGSWLFAALSGNGGNNASSVGTAGEFVQQWGSEGAIQSYGASRTPSATTARVPLTFSMPTPDDIWANAAAEVLSE